MDTAETTKCAAGEAELRAVWWMKRDLRLRDNPALTAARAGHAWVLPLYVFEPSVIEASEASAFHLRACVEALASLRERLRTMESDVFVARVEAVAALESLHRLAPFTHLFSHEETGSVVTFARDRAVAAWCKERRVTWVQVPQKGICRPLADRDTRQTRWEAFYARTRVAARPARRDAGAHGANAAPQRQIPSVCHYHFAEDPSACFRTTTMQEVSEPLALATLRGFFDAARGRVPGRNLVAESGVHARFATLAASGVGDDLQPVRSPADRCAACKGLEWDYPPGDLCARRWRLSLACVREPPRMARPFCAAVWRTNR